MTKLLHAIFALLVLIISIAPVSAQSFSVTYDFAGVSTTSGRTDPTPVPTAPGLTFGSFTAVGTGLSDHPNASTRFSFTGWPLGATHNNDVFTGSIDLGRYYSVTITPQAFFDLDLTSISFTLQRSGTGIRQYAVRSSIDGYAANLPATIDPANASLQVVSGNVFQVADAATGALTGSKINLPAAAFSDLTTPVTFRFYSFNAEANGGTFSIDNVQFTGTATISPTAPNLTITPASLSFQPTAVGATAGPLTYTIEGVNLTGDVTVTATAPYTVSKDAAGTYASSLTLTAAEVQTARTVYVKFSPVTTGTFNGSIANASASAATKTVAVTGQGINPTALSFDFNSCVNTGAPGSGFTTYSVSGAQQWMCTTFGQNSSNGININGYVSGPQENDDWLISPPLNFQSLSLPVLRFWSRGEFAGPSLQLLVSTDYSGAGDPNQATWTVLDANFPPLTNTWTLTDGINLSAFKTSPQVYIAFRYLSSEEDGAARWTVDNIDISNRSTLLTVFPAAISFGEAVVGTPSVSTRFSVQAIGYGDLTVNAPANFQVSTDSLAGFANSILVSEAAAQAGTALFVRFLPTVKALNLQGSIRILGTSLDSTTIYLSGTSYPKAETFDAGTYNLSFFGSNSNNTPTPEKIATQLTNITKVLNRINLDIVGVEEVSNDVAFDSLVNRLPHHKGILSPRWSYSFDPPNPAFPAQKIGFIYDSTTSILVEQRAMFESLYDSVRNGFTEKLPSYPGNSPESFWASGRLPYMATFSVTNNGVTKQVRVVVIHSKSGADQASYNRRVYDVRVLKDSLDAYYANDNVIILGDYNDRVFGTIYGGTGATSPFKPFVDDNTKYEALTYPLDQAGRVSFIGGTGLIDHITVSNELEGDYIPNSTEIEDPRSYISGYGATTASDHLPVFSRFVLNSTQAPLPVRLLEFSAAPGTTEVEIAWTTAFEMNARHFVVERSANGVDFTEIANVGSRGNSSAMQSYRAADKQPLTGRSYYRLKQVDNDGRATLSRVVSVLFGKSNMTFTIYPNPVVNYISMTSTAPAATIYTLQLFGADGKAIFRGKGTMQALNSQLNRQLNNMSKGMYLLNMESANEKYTQRFIKE